MPNLSMKVVAASLFAVVALGASSSASFAASRYSYGGVRYFGPAYTFQGHSGQSGNAVFFGAPPRTLPSHSGQYGNVTFLGGVQPYTYPGHSGQMGNVTYFGYRAPGTVPVQTVPTRGIVPVRR